MPVRLRLHLPIAVLTLLAISFAAVTAQDKRPVPDVSVTGVKLGDRVSGKALLGEYQPRTDEGVPTYYFYNSHITTVLKLTAASFEDPYFVTAFEVYSIGDSYQHRHFILNKIGTFDTESGIFIGFRQKGSGLALAMIVGIPNVGRSNMIGPKDVAARKGEPDTRAKNGEEETFDYRVEKLDLPADDSKAEYLYTANYRFYKKKLKRFRIAIEPIKGPEPPKTIP